MSDGFYRAFEDQHRGSRELIKTRQRVYLPFIEPLKILYPEASALDLGCGRGEWLELLTESGFKARGVDLDDGMLAVCRERGLAVQTKDAVTGLQEQSDASLAVVSGFHLAEHIPFEALQSLVAESLRALKPAGLLILETPNPENIVVGTANFYLDPTHRQPIPPLLLSFLAEYCGFARVKVIRLQGPVDLNVGRKLNMHDVLGGVSPDYAIVAQKAAPEEVLRSVSLAFEQEYGVTLGQLSGKYDQQLQQTADLAQQAMMKAEAALTAIHTSSYWRMTKPLRWAGHQVSL
jgi:O-antigen chain-terminating methyltransferase